MAKQTDPQSGPISESTSLVVPLLLPHKLISTNELIAGKLYSIKEITISVNTNTKILKSTDQANADMLISILNYIAIELSHFLRKTNSP